MAKTVEFQDPGEGIRDAEVVDVSVEPGDEVEEGQTILVVETDKAEFEIDSPFAGVVASVEVRVGDTIEVGQTLLTFEGREGSAKGRSSSRSSGAEETRGERRTTEEEGEQKGEEDEAEAREREDEAPEAKRARETDAGDRADEEDTPRASESEAGTAGRPPPVPASPATRRIARDLGVDLREVAASGEGGRVLAQDVRGHAASGSRSAERGTVSRERIELPDLSQWGPVERAPLRSVRRTIARRMVRAWHSIPHVTHNELADVTELEALRRRQSKRLEETTGARLTLTVLVLKAVASVLREHPRFNASLDEEREEIVYRRYFHLGVATDTSRGLVVPSIRNADRKSVAQLARELAELSERARNGGLGRDEMLRGTFTITNVGALGGTHFTPIINPPQVAILGLGRARWEPRYRQDDAASADGSAELVPRLLLPLCLAFDHRVNDGADAARFTNRLVEILGDPEWFAVMV